MVDKNILSPVIEEITSVKNGIETERTKVNYTHKTGNLYVPFSTQHSFSGENNLITTNTYLYDIKGNILQTTSHDATIKSVIWGYNGQYPIATIENAPYNDVAYTSFEDNYAGNSWTFGGFAFGGEVNTVNQHTGTKSFTMSGNTGSITKRDLTPNKTYIVSYWSRNGVLYVNIPNNLTTGITINGWVYYEHIFTTSLSSTTISITSNNISNGGEIIDELRLYPADAKITTYTYKPLVGITSKTDTSGHTIYYEYDGFGRLKQIKDDSGNIIKHYEYHYQDETP
jgi:YD repeat-containing protein